MVQFHVTFPDMRGKDCVQVLDRICEFKFMDELKTNDANANENYLQGVHRISIEVSLGLILTYHFRTSGT